MPIDSATDASRFWPTSVSRRRDSRNEPVRDERAEPAAERAEDVAAQPDGRGDEDEETGKELRGCR